MTERFIVIRNVPVSNYGVVGNQLTSGFPAPTAVCGLGEALVRNLVAAGVPTTFEGIAAAISQQNPVTGFPRFTRATRDEGAKVRAGEFDAPMVDEKRSTTVVTFIVKVTVAGEPSLLAEDIVIRSLAPLRFAKGNLEAAGGRFDVVIEASRAGALKRLSGDELLFEDATAVLLAEAQRTGKALHEVFADLISEESRQTADETPEAGEEPIITAAEATDAVDEDGAVAVIAERPDGRFVPVACGYALLEQPRHRQGARQAGLRTALSEPILGLARVRFVASVRQQFVRRDRKLADEFYSEEPAPAVFWRVAYDEDLHAVIARA